jgi:proteasome lid subunit RPN8/RPN11
MILKAQLKHLTAIRQHSLNHYPDECCGLLIGKIKQKEKILVKVIATENDWENQKHLFTNLTTKTTRNLRDSFSISPGTLIKIQQQARQENLDIIGVYHSHPNSPAIPSTFDQAIAWQTYSYIIVSVKEQETQELLSWRLNSARKFVAEKIKIIDQ